METEERPCNLCHWIDKPAFRTILWGEEGGNVCIDCYVKMLEEILDALVKDEHERGKLILEEYKRAEELNKRLEWDFDRPALVDCRIPSDEQFLPEHLQGLMRFKQR